MTRPLGSSGVRRISAELESIESTVESREIAGVGLRRPLIMGFVDPELFFRTGSGSGSSKILESCSEETSRVM